jgi:hypothetical protein
VSTFTAGDTAKDFTATLSDDTTPANLTGASVELHFQTPTGVLSVAATVVDPAAGTIRYSWADTDLSDDRVGVWRWEAQVTYSSGKPQTFPGEQFRVSPQIA